VSVLFADLVGYTSRAETEDPEAMREFLASYFERAAEIIERHGGTVEKFIGDAVMAVWGAPTAREDDAERAVRAALEMVASVHDLDPTMELRAAVTTGEAAVDPNAQGQGMVTGDLVNTSSRLQSVAAIGTVLVDETTMNAAGRAVAFEPAGSFELKGKAEPVTAWTALRVVAERGGAGRREMLEPPFVGRDEELRTLKEALHATGREGRARLVTAIGQAGLDKSRLAWELKKYSDGVMETVYWHESRSPAYGQGVAFWALSQMVRSRCGVVDSDGPDEVRRKLRKTLAEFVERSDERDWIEPHVATLLGVADAPAGSREELFAAWRLFFERISEQGTVAMIFDDLHLAEEGLFDFIEHLLEWAQDRPILVVALARPELLERRARWGAGHVTSTTMHLKPLTDDDMEDLLLGMVPGLPEETIASIVSRAEGVPLYAVEIVRMLLDSGALERRGDRYRLNDESAAESVPASLRALIAARLDALASDERAIV
jgi:class 3 adenylate cyclase